jgi:hypothetical protein
MSKISLTSICSSKMFFRLANARHIREDKEGEGRNGKAGGLAPKHKNLTAYGNGQTIFHYNPIKNAPKCTIFIFKMISSLLDETAQKKSRVRAWERVERRGRAGDRRRRRGRKGPLIFWHRVPRC